VFENIVGGDDAGQASLVTARRWSFRPGRVDIWMFQPGALGRLRSLSMGLSRNSIPIETEHRPIAEVTWTCIVPPWGNWSFLCRCCSTC